MLCLDCPDLMADRMPVDWKPRARCCRDEHIERRASGQFEGWQGIARARELSAEEDGRKSRQVRRAKERAARKAGGRA